MVAEYETQFQRIKTNFRKFGQDHIFQFWDQLSSEQQKRFLLQLESVDLQLVEHLVKEFIKNQPSVQHRKRQFFPPHVTCLPKTTRQIREAEKARRIGADFICKGKVGILLVAGGQGTRLGFNEPKGKFPFTPIRQKSLFQFHAEKIQALKLKYQTRLPWYIMTSEINDSETKNFFAANDYFGLDSTDIFFFKQQMIPSVDERGKLLLENKDKIFTNPNGHGGTFQALRHSGALDDMICRGVEEIFYFQVDNVLIKICDPIFLGYHLRKKAEMSSKVLTKRDPYEKVGVIGYLDGKLTVIEYSDLTREEMLAKNPDGSLKFNAGSIAIHMINRSFIERLTNGDMVLPYHRAHKRIPYIDQSGRKIYPQEPNGYKFELFIFEALQYTNHSVVMEVERKEEFSPIKNAEGLDSPQTAVQDLCNLYGGWLEAAGFKIDRNDQNNDVLDRIEISPLYALDQEEFVAKVSPDMINSEKLYFE